MAARNTAPASLKHGLRELHIHLLAWLVIGCFLFAQTPLRNLSADTKHDLSVHPAGFLAGAMHPWSDLFPLGQLQNQAYGYLFPQGLFFLLTHPLPADIAQRLWWLLVCAVGWSGMFKLALALSPHPRSYLFPVLGATAFAFSPRTLSTLSTISSETWPVMLAPWVILGTLSITEAHRNTARALAASVLPVALMGAVNATATLAACTPAACWLLASWWHARERRARKRIAVFAGAWLLGCALVSLWWIIPLLVLGHYSPPFIEFIESAYVTTRWLNLPEILRGTTSWAPFVDIERSAGNLLVSEPIFIILSLLFVAVGLAGLAYRVRQSRDPRLLLMLGVGLIILGAAHGPFAESYQALLDGPLAFARNLHKFDPLVRIPLCLGMSFFGATATRVHPRRSSANALSIVLVACLSAPLWSLRLLPEGNYSQVPAEWQATAEYLNAHAQDTRTLIWPPTNFARQSWGWTRDEPLQPLLDVPWVVRDAVPLVPPEAIRLLDGLMVLVEENPEAALKVLPSMGIGAVVIRHDLQLPPAPEGQQDAKKISRKVAKELATLPVEHQRFGEIADVFLLDPHANMQLLQGEQLRVAGGGEVLPWLAAATDTPLAVQLVDASDNPTVLTDTPQNTGRNYGQNPRTLYGRGPLSAPQLKGEEHQGVHNRLPDYPSAGTRSVLINKGGLVRAGSAASQPDSFGGAQAAHSTTAAVDGQQDTAWFPAPGAPPEKRWIELQWEGEDEIVELKIRPTADTRVRISRGAETLQRTLKGKETTTVRMRGSGTSVRVELSDPGVGISTLSIQGHPITQILQLPEAPPSVRAFFFQDALPQVGTLRREFHVQRPMRVQVHSPGCVPISIDEHKTKCGVVELAPGSHELQAQTSWVLLQEEGFHFPTAHTQHIAPGENIAASSTDRILLTKRAFNPGSYATLTHPLSPISVDGGFQGFIIPAGYSGKLELGFSGQRPYQLGLAIGAVLGILTLLACLFILIRTPRFIPTPSAHEARDLWVSPLLVLILGVLGGWPGLLIGLLTLGILRFTLISPPLLIASTTTIAALWLSHAPWPQAHYAGDEAITTWLLLVALSALYHGRPKRSHTRASEPSRRGIAQPAASPHPRISD